MAKTTKKTTHNRTIRRKPGTAKESHGTTKNSGARSENKKQTAPSGERARKPASKPSTAGQTEVTVDRRRSDRRAKSEPVAVERRKLERREKVTRRRQIDPTTCERDYSDDEVEFMSALDNYKRASGRMFPTCSEILEVIRSLGYTKARAGQDSSLASLEAAGQDTTLVNASASWTGDEDQQGMDEEFFACSESFV